MVSVIESNLKSKLTEIISSLNENRSNFVLKLKNNRLEFLYKKLNEEKIKNRESPIKERLTLKNKGITCVIYKFRGEQIYRLNEIRYNENGDFSLNLYSDILLRFKKIVKFDKQKKIVVISTKHSEKSDLNKAQIKTITQNNFLFQIKTI